MAAAAAHVHLTSIPTRPLPLTSISRPFDTVLLKFFLPRAGPSQAPQRAAPANAAHCSKIPRGPRAWLTHYYSKA